MRKGLMVLAVLLCVGIGTVPVFAHSAAPDSGIDQGPLNVAGAKLDAPDLIKFNDDVSIGVEVSKDFYQYVKGDGWISEDGDHGWSGYAKATVKWSLLDFSKK